MLVMFVVVTGGHAVGKCVDRVHVVGHFVGHARWKCVVNSIIGCRSNSCYKLQGENIIRYRTVYMNLSGQLGMQY